MTDQITTEKEVRSRAERVFGELPIVRRRRLFTALNHAQATGDHHAEATVIRELDPHQKTGNNHTIPVEIRFFEKVAFGVNGCWIWRANIDGGGYGIFSLPPDSKAHRAAWRLFNGEIPDGLCVLHKCDVACCVNPDHLFLGTQQDNIADMVAKGRQQGDSGRGGADHPMAKLTWDEVRQIRAKYAKGKSQHQLAREFGMAVMPINRIVRHISWREE